MMERGHDICFFPGGYVGDGMCPACKFTTVCFADLCAGCKKDSARNFVWGFVCSKYAMHYWTFPAHSSFCHIPDIPAPSSLRRILGIPALPSFCRILDIWQVITAAWPMVMSIFRRLATALEAFPCWVLLGVHGFERWNRSICLKHKPPYSGFSLAQDCLGKHKLHGQWMRSSELCFLPVTSFLLLLIKSGHTDPHWSDHTICPRPTLSFIPRVMTFPQPFNSDM